MGIFNRRKQSAQESYSEHDFTEEDYLEQDSEVEEAEETESVLEPPVNAADAEPGPYDDGDAPEDGMPRLDLGSVRVPVPDGAQLQVEMDPEGPLRAVHLVTAIGQFTISAFAAPRSGGLWTEVSRELAEQLRGDGATVRRKRGEWGEELAGAADEVALRFVGVDGPRWLLRGVVAGPREHAEYADNLLHDIVRYTVVVRGEQPLPVRSPLPIQLPAELAEHIEQARAEQAKG